MSKLKTPQEKKRASLARDCRNVYGESPHGARKSIPRNKAISRRAERHAANRALTPAVTDALDAMAHAARAQGRLKRLRGFRKVQDAPLGRVIEFKKQRRISQSGRKQRAKALWAARASGQPGTGAG